jgi:hypothetical protein
MADFLEFMTCVSFRVPIKPDGTLGEPQIVKRFTSPIKGAQHKVKKTVVRQLAVSAVEEVYI